MLRELNRIAAGLLGLHGYPAQTWTPPGRVAASGHSTGRAASVSRSGKTRTVAVRERLAGPATRVRR